MKWADERGLEWALRAYGSWGRPLYLLAWYAAWRLVRDPVLLFDVLHPLLAFTVWVAAVYRATVKTLGPRGAALACTLVPLVHAPTFIAGGFQANSLALGLGLLTFTLDLSRPRGVLAAAGLALAVAAVHPWTAAMVLAALALHGMALRSPRVVAVALGSGLAGLALAWAATGALAPGTRFEYHLLGPLRELIFPASLEALRACWGELYKAFTLYDWGTALQPAAIVAAALTARVTPASSLMAVALPALFTKYMGISFRFVQNSLYGLQAAHLLARLDPLAARLAALMVLARTAVYLSGLTPLEHPLWTKLVAG